MSPYVVVNTALIGFFGFAAIYHFILWSHAKHQAVLLVFALLCLVTACHAADVIALASARSVAAGQRALDIRVVLALLGQISAVWLLSLLSPVRARPYVWLVTVVFLIAVVVNLTVLHLAGTVTAVERISTAWGEPISVLRRDTPRMWLSLGPLYATALSVNVFGFVCGARVWFSGDRIGGTLLALAMGVGILSALWGLQIDTSRSRQPYYLGGIQFAPVTLLFAVQIARDHRVRGERLAAAEHRFRAIFDQTFQFIGLMSLDGVLLEVNRTALQFAGIRSEAVIGQAFWDTPWWTHSPELQQRLREAVAAAASGEVVRFDATHYDAVGRVHDVDFSLKPVRDERGAVVLLIPEGRDVTERKHAEQALEESREQLRRLADGLLMAREDERTAIAREIHDVLGQTLTALKMDTAWIGSHLIDRTAVRLKLDEMADLIDDSVLTVRRIATDLRPGVLDDLGLLAAVEWQTQEFSRRTGIECVLSPGIDDSGLDPLVATAMFRIVQESLTNVARHSRSSRVNVTFEQAGEHLVLEVRDNGVGIAPADAASARSIGLAGMRERAQLVGGRFSISGAAGYGTTVRVEIPQQVPAGV